MNPIFIDSYIQEFRDFTRDLPESVIRDALELCVNVPPDGIHITPAQTVAFIALRKLFKTAYNEHRAELAKRVKEQAERFA